MAVSGGIVSTGHFSTSNQNLGIANGNLNTMRTGYNGYWIKGKKSRGKNGRFVGTKGKGFRG
jgi:hypothetical protein